MEIVPAKDDYYFFGEAHPAQKGDSDGTTDPNVFPDDAVPKMNLVHLPICREHNTKLSVGGVIISPAGKEGSKIIGGWLNGNDPVGAWVIEEVKSGKLPQLSLAHAFRHGKNGNDVRFHNIKMPFEVSLTRKAARKGCNIFYGTSLPALTAQKLRALGVGTRDPPGETKFLR